MSTDDAEKAAEKRFAELSEMGPRALAELAEEAVKAAVDAGEEAVIKQADVDEAYEADDRAGQLVALIMMKEGHPDLREKLLGMSTRQLVKEALDQDIDEAKVDEADSQASVEKRKEALIALIVDPAHGKEPWLRKGLKMAKWKPAHVIKPGSTSALPANILWAILTAVFWALVAVRLKNDLGKRHAPPLSTSMDMKEYPWPVFTICPFSDNDVSISLDDVYCEFWDYNWDDEASVGECSKQTWDATDNANGIAGGRAVECVVLNGIVPAGQKDSGPSGTCDEDSWPDAEHPAELGECQASIGYFGSYGNCKNYCETIGRRCTKAWEKWRPETGVDGEEERGCDWGGEDGSGWDFGVCECWESGGAPTVPRFAKADVGGWHSIDFRVETDSHEEGDDPVYPRVPKGFFLVVTDVHPDNETEWTESYIGPGAFVSGELAKTSYEYLVVSCKPCGVLDHCCDVTGRLRACSAKAAASAKTRPLGTKTPASATATSTSGFTQAQMESNASSATCLRSSPTNARLSEARPTSAQAATVGR